MLKNDVLRANLQRFVLSPKELFVGRVKIFSASDWIPKRRVTTQEKGSHPRRWRNPGANCSRYISREGKKSYEVAGGLPGGGDRWADFPFAS